MKKEKIVLTGATGIVGSHILYQLVEEMLFENRSCELYLIVRPKEGMSGSERLREEVFTNHLLPAKLKNLNLDQAMEHIHVIEGDLSTCIFPKSLGNELTLYHVAASVNLGTSDSCFEDIYKNNYLATKSLLTQLDKRIKKINFVSTAFSTGDRNATIVDDYHNLNSYAFRNHYEEYKHKIESEILKMAENGEFECCILRPSVICGRLIDEPHYVMNRYIVFYLIGAFFNKMRKKFGQIDKFRIVCDPLGGLNIVPVDYVAKAILKASKESEQQVNITATNNIPNSYWIPYIMNAEGITDFEFVSEVPEDPTAIEKLYYKTVGPQINQYLKTSAHNFESSNIRRILKDVNEPDVKGQFPAMYNFAHDNDFQLCA